ncbi:MAG: glycosyltransferase family 39 protein [Solirubrobacteraceae bacterium]
MTSVGDHAPATAGDQQAARQAPTPASAWLLLGAITAVGVVLRAVFVGAQGLGYEEAFTAQIVNQSSLTAVWHGVKATESTPPLYYVLTWLWVKLSASHSEVSLRMVSLLAGSLAVPVSFLAARHFVSTRLALVVAWLCAVSPMLVSYAIYARSYALLVLAGALSVWALGALLEQPSARRWALWGLTAVLCLWTHYFTAFLLAGEVGVLLIRLPAERRRLLLCLAAIAAATAPLWSVFLDQSGDSERTAYIAAEPLGGRLEGVVRQFAMGTNVPTAWLEGAGIAIVALAVAFALVQTGRRRSMLTLATLALAGAGLPILSALTAIDDHLLARNLLGIWICVAPFAAYGLTRLRSVPLVAYSVICIAAVIAVQSDWRYQASTDWRGASARLRMLARGEPVAVEPGLELAVAGLYMHRTPLTTPLSTTNLWVMVQPERGAGERALNPVADPPLAQLWGAQFKAVGEIDYHGFRLIHLRAPAATLVAPAPAQNGPPTTPLAFVLRP